MTRDELKEKVATAIMSRFVKPDMHETVTWADGSKQWRVDHFGEMAEAALSAIEAAGMAVVPVGTLGGLVTDEIYDAFHAGIVINGEWMDGGRSEGRWLRLLLGLEDGRHPMKSVWDALPGLVDRRVKELQVGAMSNGGVR